MPADHFTIDDTHDPDLESWVESANEPGGDFPIQNLPLASVRRGGETRACMRIGDALLDLRAAADAGLDLGAPAETLASINAIASAGAAADVRRRAQSLLKSDASELRDHDRRDEILFDAADAEFDLPMRTVDYTDFYASIHHATNVGSMFRPDNPLLPNYKWIPIGYHGRASSLVASGAPVRRPRGQLLPGASIDDGPPEYGPCKLLDYEMEVGFFVGRGNELGAAIGVDEAERNLLGVCLVNDWSARDIQKWEYQPLGPFLAKSFATTLAPVVVTMEALAPFRTASFERGADDPAPLPHLDSDENRSRGGIDMTVEVHFATKQMRDKGIAPVRLSRGAFRNMYWTPAQMLAHHASNGCNMRPGDLFASGTVSGPTRDSRGSLLELTWDGDPFATPPVLVPGSQRSPLELPTGETRKFLADGDEVILRAFCERDGYRRIGFGECRGIIQPAS